MAVTEQGVALFWGEKLQCGETLVGMRDDGGQERLEVASHTLDGLQL